MLDPREKRRLSARISDTSIRHHQEVVEDKYLNIQRVIFYIWNETWLLPLYTVLDDISKCLQQRNSTKIEEIVTGKMCTELVSRSLIIFDDLCQFLMIFHPKTRQIQTSRPCKRPNGRSPPRRPGTRPRRRLRSATVSWWKHMGNTWEIPQNLRFL